MLLFLCYPIVAPVLQPLRSGLETLAKGTCMASLSIIGGAIYVRNY